MNATAASPAVPLRRLFPEAGAAVADVAVTDITTHSGRVQPGGLFIACRGYRGHGLDYLDDALRRQPAAIAWEPEAALRAPVLPDAVLPLAVPALAEQVGIIADRFFGAPSQALRVTGITGTNGKTTTAWLAAAGLRALGHSAGYMGTLGWGLGTDLEPTSLTTPGCIVAHRRLRALRDAGADCVVLEASSHGLDQGRLDGVAVRTAAFTNLSHDHLDYHGDFASYGGAKERLFRFDSLESVVINVGDEFGAGLAERCADVPQQLRVALRGAAAPGPVELAAEIVAVSAAGLQLKLTGRHRSADLHSPLWGRFNAENLLVATGILLQHGAALPDAAAALSTCGGPPGRMEVLPLAPGAPQVVVDFAHTPDGLQQALVAMREHGGGELTVVFGCGGERDIDKRPVMGRVAAALADRVIVTSDNPRREDPAAIAESVLTDIRDAGHVEVELDRRAAIQRALDTSPGAAVLIAGKGSETRQYAAGGSEAFADAAVVREHLGSAE